MSYCPFCLPRPLQLHNIPLSYRVFTAVQKLTILTVIVEIVMEHISIAFLKIWFSIYHNKIDFNFIVEELCEEKHKLMRMMDI